MLLAVGVEEGVSGERLFVVVSRLGNEAAHSFFISLPTPKKHVLLLTQCSSKKCGAEYEAESQVPPVSDSLQC